MSTTLTIRTDDQLREALRKRAELQGKSVSELARELLLAALEERPLAQRTGHLRGRLDLRSATADPRRQRIKKHNWRP
jgi:plasmid stability protein